MFMMASDYGLSASTTCTALRRGLTGGVRFAGFSTVGRSDNARYASAVSESE